MGSMPRVSGNEQAGAHRGCGILVVDAGAGATAADEAAARILLRSGKPVFLAANKVDSERRIRRRGVVVAGPGCEPHAISAMHGRGCSTCSTGARRALRWGSPRRRAAVLAGWRLVGKPNVSAKSPAEQTAGDQRSVVHEAGTTVDPVDSRIGMGGDVWRFVDAGLRRKVGQASASEFYACARTPPSTFAEVAIDARRSRSPNRTLRVISMVIEAGRALVLAYNKWDLVDEETGALSCFSARSTESWQVLGAT